MPESQQPNDPEEAPDAELMKQVRKGDLDSFVPLIERYQQKLVNFFTRLGVYHEAEDLVQETFVRIWKSRKKYEEKAKFRTFLYVVARNIWRDFLRRTGRYEDFKDRLEEELEHREPERSKTAARLDMQEALQQLSEKLRVVLVMKVEQGLTYQEIAEALDIPLGTVKSRMNLAVEELKRILNPTGRTD